MKFFKYKKWDGKQKSFSLKRKSVIDKFMENIMKGMNPNMSYAQMLWEGFNMKGMSFRVMGLEEMITELKEKMYDLFSDYSLEKAFDRPMDDIRYLLEEESKIRVETGNPDVPSFDSLPAGLYEKLLALNKELFMNEESLEMLSYWQGRRDDILELYEFYSQYHEYFTGDEYLDFDEALELMRQFKSIDKLKEQVMSGNIKSIDMDMLREILGDDAAESVMIMLQIPEILKGDGVARTSMRKLELTPKGLRSLGETAFGKLYRQMKRDRHGRQLGNAPQMGEVKPDSSRPYRYGDRFDLDLSKTILSSISKGGVNKNSVNLKPDDFHVREREQYVNSTVVLLLDLSWSMSYGGRFEAAKKVALALDHYIRTRFPRDKVHVVGFNTEAKELKDRELANAMWDSNQPFTNLQGALRLGMKLIHRSGNRNNRVLVITDGQPTAYYMGEHLHVEMPTSMFGLSQDACRATLKEVRKVTSQGMNIEVFMLDDNPVLIEFTTQMTKINGGRSVLCMPDELGRLIMVEEIKRRGGKI
ncbi:VWA domain-containing protein [Spirochaetota bacterium]